MHAKFLAPGHDLRCSRRILGTRTSCAFSLVHRALCNLNLEPMTSMEMITITPDIRSTHMGYSDPRLVRSQGIILHGGKEKTSRADGTYSAINTVYLDRKGRPKERPA